MSEWLELECFPRVCVWGLRLSVLMFTLQFEPARMNLFHMCVHPHMVALMKLVGSRYTCMFEVILANSLV